jgi:D-glycero-D-manno-heptose 1,7-bisphosphate phosphatase
MLSAVEQAGGKISRVYYCTHRKEAGCSCRKPRPGLLKKAVREFGINLKKAYFIGDTIRDVLTARAAVRNRSLFYREKKSYPTGGIGRQNRFCVQGLLTASKFLTR